MTTSYGWTPISEWTKERYPASVVKAPVRLCESGDGCTKPATLVVLGHSCLHGQALQMRCRKCRDEIGQGRFWCTACGHRGSSWLTDEVAL